MKHGKLVFGFMALFCAAALFLGCPTEAGDNTNYGIGNPIEEEIVITTADGTKYFSLTAEGLIPVTDTAKIASKEWDIAFQRSRLIFTNSGATADSVSSGGDGGVWFTDKTDFASVSDGDRVVDFTKEGYAEYEEFTKDVVKYTSATASSRLNIMTYVGYAGGTGTQEDWYKTNTPSSNPPPADFLPYMYNKKHFVSMTSMSGPNGAEYELSNQVYVIKHGDGVHYSKVQITEYTSRSADNAAEPPVAAADILKVKYQNF
jgi:hypothetical protein